MQEEIITHLRNHPPGSTSESIAELFLKFKRPDKTLAHVAVKAILSHDNRAFCDDEGLWHARQISVDQTHRIISEVQWIAVLLHTDTTNREIIHISLWNPLPSAQCLCSLWLSDPGKLSPEDRNRLCDPHDLPFDASMSTEHTEQIASALRCAVPVFLSQDHYSALSIQILGNRQSFDSCYLLNQLFRALDKPTCPSQLEDAALDILNIRCTASSAYKRGELFCSVVKELFCDLRKRGVETYEELDKTLQEDIRPCLAGKAFSFDDLSALPPKPGVYGFKDKKESYIYIGKASNLRRQIQDHFRFNNQMPDNLRQLILDSHSFTVHLCGSELEALLYERRLIEKYSPPLNDHSLIVKRKDTFQTPDDSIVLLPHAQSGKGISIWIKKGRKIRIRPFDQNWNEQPELIKEIEDFFFYDKSVAAFDDYSEFEIISTWCKQNPDRVILIPTSDQVSSKEILECMKNCWH